MAKTLRHTEALSSLEGNNVHIVGPRVLQNTLLADVLTAETGVTCRLHASAESLPDPSPAARRRHLVLEDCLHTDFHFSDGLLAAGQAMVPQGALRSLFNLPGDWGQESVALRLGLRGFFYECDGPETLVKGVRRIFAGELWVSRKTIADSFDRPASPLSAPRPPPCGLTPREMKILRLVAEGASNETAAARLRISAHTVKTHLYHAYRKTGVKNRVQASRWVEKNLA